MSAAAAPCPRLPAAVLQEIVEDTPLASPDDVVKTYLLDVTSELLALQEASTTTTSLGASSTDRYSPSLQVLHTRLQHGHHSPFPGLDSRSGEAFASAGKAHRAAVPLAVDRPLDDFEDLYYAILATVKEMHEALVLRLNNGFVDPNALLFPASRYTVRFFQEWLAHQWAILNEASLVRALDVAVRKALVEGALCHGLRSQVESGQITHEEAEFARAQLYRPDVFADVPGLSWVGNEHAAMINGRLNEKYRAVFQTEKLAQAKKTRWAKKRDRMQKPVKGGPRAGSRVCSQQGMSSWRETQTQPQMQMQMQRQRQRREDEDEDEDKDKDKHEHEDELRRKSAPAPAATRCQAIPAWPYSVRGGAVSYNNSTVTINHTPQRQAHAPPQPQPHVEHVLQGTQHCADANAFPAPARSNSNSNPRERREHRVTAYQAWLKESASDNARSFMGQRCQAQSDVSDVSPPAFDGTAAPMDMDDDGAF